MLQTAFFSASLFFIVALCSEIFADQSKGYELSLYDKDRTLVIDGCLNIGVTREVEDLFILYESITRVELNSQGGNIYQGRGLARVIRENEADTHVNQECSSACVTAFIAGKRRTLKRGAKLGFHQYRYEAEKNFILNPYAANPHEEQRKDLELFRREGVSEDFLEMILRQPVEKMWYPSEKLLVDMGIVDEVLN